MKSELNDNLHVDSRARNFGLNDPLSPPLLIYDGIKV